MIAATYPSSDRLHIRLDGEGGSVYGTKDAFVRAAHLLIHEVERQPASANALVPLHFPVDAVLDATSDVPDYTFYLGDAPPRTDEMRRPGRALGWLIFLAIALVLMLAGVGAVAVVRFALGGL